MRGMGHNSAAFGEDVIDEGSPVLPEDHKKLFHYVQWHLADYITGTQGMTPEQEGIYMRFLVRLYDRGQAFQNDDKLLSLAMGLDVRRWRRIKDDLIRFGKIIVKYGHLTNSRFEREKQKRADDLRKQAESTRKYWEKKRSEQVAQNELRAEVGAKSGQSPKEVEPKSDEKPNKINEDAQLPISQTRDQRLEEERKKEPPLDPPEGEKPKRAKQFPPDWMPSKSLFEWATGDKIGATSDQVLDQFEAFRDFHVSKGNKYVSWDLAFQTWMRRAKGYGRLDVKQQRTHGYNGAYTGDLL